MRSAGTGQRSLQLITGKWYEWCHLWLGDMVPLSTREAGTFPGEWQFDGIELCERLARSLADSAAAAFGFDPPILLVERLVSIKRDHGRVGVLVKAPHPIPSDFSNCAAEFLACAMGASVDANSPYREAILRAVKPLLDIDGEKRIPVPMALDIGDEITHVTGRFGAPFDKKTIDPETIIFQGLVDALSDSRRELEIKERKVIKVNFNVERFFARLKAALGDKATYRFTVRSEDNGAGKLTMELIDFSLVNGQLEF